MNSHFTLLLLLAILFHSAVQVYASRSSENNPIQNAYQISVRVRQVDNIPLNAIYAQINDKVLSPLGTTGSGPFSFFFQESNSDYVILLHDKNQVTSDNSVLLRIFNSQTKEIIATFNVSQGIVQNFPHTSNFSPFKLWPSYSVTANTSVDSMQAIYSLQYEGVLDIGGKPFKFPLWGIIVTIVGSALAISTVIASIDICCRPPESVSGCAIWTGNLLWLFFGGLQVAVVYLLAGIVLCISIIFLPFGVALIRIAVFQFAPFGREVKQSESSSACTFLGTLIWLIFFGLPLVLCHLILGIVLCLLLITIPFGLQHFKLAKIALMPFGHHVVFEKNTYGDRHERAPLNPPGGPVAYRYA